MKIVMSKADSKDAGISPDLQRIMDNAFAGLQIADPEVKVRYHYCPDLKKSTIVRLLKVSGMPTTRPFVRLVRRFGFSKTNLAFHSSAQAELFDAMLSLSAGTGDTAPLLTSRKLTFNPF